MALKDDIPSMLYSLMIDVSFEWKVVVGRMELQSSAGVFAPLSQQLSSLSDVFGVLRCIETNSVLETRIVVLLNCRWLGKESSGFNR